MKFTSYLQRAAGAWLLVASTTAFSADVAVFGDNGIDDLLNANGHTATVVSDADLATPGFLDAFDLFIYTRDGSSFGTSLSADAAANVASFVAGNIVLFTSDLADNEFPGDATDTLMLNAVGWASNKGYIGEFTGSCAAMSSNTEGLNPIGLFVGECTSLAFGPGGDPMDILDNGHPVVAGVPDPVSLGDSHEFFALVTADPVQVIAVNSEEVPSIVVGEAIPGRALFKVTKTFSDGSTDEIDVMLTCNSGLPLEQTFTIAGGDPDGVTFVVTDIPESGATCEVTESGVPAGYTAVLNGGAGCEWEDVTVGFHYCQITNEANPATYTVFKDWTVYREGGDVVVAAANVTIECDSAIVGGDEDDGTWSLSDTLGDGETLVATVDTTTGSATCSASEVITQSGVEQSSVGCGETSLAAGGSHTCTFTNTVFFEGIPTLSQYGLAILVLLTLGVGFIGFRRFA